MISSLINHALITASQRIARANLARHMPVTERQAYWSDEEPTELEIRSAEKRHKDAFDADELVEMVASHPAEILEAMKAGNKAALGSILVGLYQKHLDEMVEYAVYGRVLTTSQRAFGLGTV